MNILEKAILFATERHEGMVRKVSGIPYVVHLLEAVTIAATITDNLEVLASAMLHDVVEDTTTTMKEVEDVFGKPVASLIAVDTEDKMVGIPPSESWKMRKEATIDLLKTASKDEKIIVLADKLSNIRAIQRDTLTIGDKVWERFNQKDKAMHEWYYRALAKGLEELSEYVAYQEFCCCIEDIFEV
jgi:(p)ppGpp synthase/HD superfamily hydrolase